MRRQQIIDPKLLRKASRSREQYAASVPEMPETSVSVDADYSVSVDTKGFEVRDVFLAPGSATAEFFHDKKVRMYLVIGGEGFAISSKEGEGALAEFTNKPLSAGSYFVCEPGTKYRICATGESAIQLIAIQDSKYESKLTETAPALVSELGAQINRAVKAAASRPESRRDRSKAAAQQTEIAASKGKLGVSVAPSGLPAGFVPEGINAKPMVFHD